MKQEQKGFTGQAECTEIAEIEIFGSMVIKNRPQYVPDGIQEEIGKIGSLFSLKSLFRQAFRCADMEAFEAVLRRVRDVSRPSGEGGEPA